MSGETLKTNPVLHVQQPLFQQLCPEIKPWERPCYWPTPGCLWPWTWPRWSWLSGKTLNQPIFTCWTTFVTTTLPRNQALGVSLLSAYSWQSMALTLAKMVLDVQKNQKLTQFIIPNNSCFNNCLKKSIPGDVWAQVLQEPVGGPHVDQGQKSGLTHHFWTLGVKTNPLVPHTWCYHQTLAWARGREVVQIYRRITKLPKLQFNLVTKLPKLQSCPNYKDRKEWNIEVLENAMFLLFHRGSSDQVTKNFD